MLHWCATELCRQHESARTNQNAELELMTCFLQM